MVLSVVLIAVCAGVGKKYGRLGKSLTTFAVSFRSAVVYSGFWWSSGFGA
jgi:hypothetical protein